MSRAKPRGRCAVCSRSVAILANGKPQKHGVNGYSGGYCAGNVQPAIPDVKPLDPVAAEREAWRAKIRDEVGTEEEEGGLGHPDPSVRALLDLLEWDAEREAERS